jgi:cytochrome c551
VRRNLGVLLALIPVFLIAACSNQEQPSSPTPPAPPGGGAATGGPAIFAQHCAGCHGTGGQGGKAPNLAAEAGHPEADLRKVIESGDGKMPSFKGKLTDAQITEVVTYIKGLG